MAYISVTQPLSTIFYYILELLTLCGIFALFFIIRSFKLLVSFKLRPSLNLAIDALSFQYCVLEILRHRRPVRADIV
jgi:hypothetical protein